MIELYLKWFALFIICLILQTSFIPLLSLFEIQPDLLILVLFFLCSKHGSLPGIYVGFFLGLCMDLYIPAMPGQNALAKTVVGAFFGIFNEKVMRTDVIFKIMIIIIGFIIHDTIFSLIELIKNGNSPLFVFIDLYKRIIPRALYTLLLASLVYLWNTFVQPNFRR